MEALEALDGGASGKGLRRGMRPRETKGWSTGLEHWWQRSGALKEGIGALRWEWWCASDAQEAGKRASDGRGTCAGRLEARSWDTKGSGRHELWVVFGLQETSSLLPEPRRKPARILSLGAFSHSARTAPIITVTI